MVTAGGPEGVAQGKMGGEGELGVCSAQGLQLLPWGDSTQPTFALKAAGGVQVL